MAKYSKPFLTYMEQLDLLVERGLSVDDPERALHNLKQYGYYRLSAYWYPFRIRPRNHREGIDTPSDKFNPGISFEQIIEVFEFDRALRRSIWPAIEAIEVAVRVAIAYELGQHGAYAFVDPTYLGDGAEAPSLRNPDITQLEDFQQQMHRSVRSSKESFAKHFRNNYEGTLPVWAAIELWDFGMLSSYYQIMRPVDREAVAASFGLRSARLLGSWLEAINVLRNICAHHGRLNRRHVAIAPRIPKPKTSPEFSHLYPMSDTERHSLYPLLCVLSYLTHQITGDKRWQANLAACFDQLAHLSKAKPDDFGVPEHWSEQALWKCD